MGSLCVFVLGCEQMSVSVHACILFSRFLLTRRPGVDLCKDSVAGQESHFCFFLQLHCLSSFPSLHLFILSSAEPPARFGEKLTDKTIQL